MLHFNNGGLINSGIVMITKLLISVFIILGKLNEKYLCNFKQYCITETLLCFIFICCLIFPLSHDINPEQFFFPLTPLELNFYVPLRLSEHAKVSYNIINFLKVPIETT